MRSVLLTFSKLIHSVPGKGNPTPDFQMNGPTRRQRHGNIQHYFDSKIIKDIKPIRKISFEKFCGDIQTKGDAMQFVIKALDGEGLLERRMEVRPRHLENMGKVNGKVVCAGGLLDDEGKMKGSVMVMDFADRSALDAYLASEPYILEHVWEKVEVERINVVLVNGEKYQNY